MAIGILEGVVGTQLVVIDSLALVVADTPSTVGILAVRPSTDTLITVVRRILVVVDPAPVGSRHLSFQCLPF